MDADTFETVRFVFLLGVLGFMAFAGVNILMMKHRWKTEEEERARRVAEHRARLAERPKTTAPETAAAAGATVASDRDTYSIGGTSSPGDSSASSADLSTATRNRVASWATDPSPLASLRSLRHTNQYASVARLASGAPRLPIWPPYSGQLY